VVKALSYPRDGKPYRTPDALFTVPLPAVAEYRADLNVLFQELYARIVTASRATRPFSTRNKGLSRRGITSSNRRLS